MRWDRSSGSVAVLALAGILLITSFALGQGEPADFYVSTEGNEAWTGTLPEPNADRTDGPFATLHRARDAMRALKQTEKGDAHHDIEIRGGTYYLSEPLVLGPQDSDVWWSPYRNEKVVLSGGRPITGWQKHDENIWYADIPEAAEGKWKFRQLFVDGKREIRARYPNYDPTDILRKGWLRAQAFSDFGCILSGIVNMGDFLEYQFTAPADGTYHLWVGYASEMGELDKSLRVTVDDSEISLGEMPPSGSWRKVNWVKGGSLELGAGVHTFRVERNDGPNRIVHFDAFVLTTDPDAEPVKGIFDEPAEGQHQVAIQAESPAAREAGVGSHVGGFQTFNCPGYGVRDARHRIACAPGTIRETWAQAPDAEIDVFAAWGWFNEIVRVADVDFETSEIRIEGTECQGDIREGNRFYISNVFEELDQPGEWYLDSEAGRLYYWPRDKPPTQSLVVAPALTTLVHMKAPSDGDARVSKVWLLGITFTETDYTPDHVSVRTAHDAAVLLENAWDCSVNNCRFVNVGGSGVRLHLDCRGNEIFGNEITVAGGNGVILTGPKVGYGIPFDEDPAAAELGPIGNRIVANVIHHCGQVHKYVAGVHLDSRPKSLAGAEGNEVSGNHIHHMPRNGIFAFMHQGGNLIASNHIHDIMLESDDGGGIHLSTCDLECPGNVLTGNTIHDVYGWRQRPDGEFERMIGIGIYLDNVTSNCDVTLNTIYRTSMGCVFLHGGANNVVESNVLVNDRARQVWVSDYSEKMKGNRIIQNVICALSPGSALYNLNRVRDETLEEVDRNLYWTGGEPVTIGEMSLEDWRAKGFDTDSLVADPMFEDAEQDNYSLKDSSPAWRLGFRPDH